MSLPPSTRSRIRALARALCVSAALSTGLAGCTNFVPLYGVTTTGSPVSAELANIHIVEQETRVNQLIRNQLISTMSPPGTGGTGQYVLELATSSSTAGLVLERNEDVSRQLYKLNVAYNLTDTATGNVIHRGQTFSHVAYDRVASEFSNIQAQVSAEERASIQVAEDIRTRLAAFFSSR